MSTTVGILGFNRCISKYIYIPHIKEDASQIKIQIKPHILVGPLVVFRF